MHFSKHERDALSALFQKNEFAIMVDDKNHIMSSELSSLCHNQTLSSIQGLHCCNGYLQTKAEQAEQLILLCSAEYSDYLI